MSQSVKHESQIIRTERRTLKQALNTKFTEIFLRKHEIEETSYYSDVEFAVSLKMSSAWSISVSISVVNFI